MLDDESAEVVSNHLEDCTDCRRQVTEFAPEAFLGRLRDAQLAIETSASGSAEPSGPSTGASGADDGIVDSSSPPCMSSTGQVDATTRSLMSRLRPFQGVSGADHRGATNDAEPPYARWISDLLQFFCTRCPCQPNATTMRTTAGVIVNPCKIPENYVKSISAQRQTDGRRTGLKIRSSQEGVGSSPTFGSIYLRQIATCRFALSGNKLGTALR